MRTRECWYQSYHRPCEPGHDYWLRRNLGSIMIGLIACIVSFISKLSAAKIPNYTDLISGALSLTSVATAFLFASFALLPALTDSKFIKSLVDLKVDKKLIDRLVLTTVGYFTNSIFSIILLFFNADSSSLLNKLVIAIWIGIGIFSINETFKVLRILWRFNKWIT